MKSNLNPKYTFDSFVVGPFNELVHSVARSIAKSPGSTYNPLFFYGEVGTGKTHLLHAIGNEIKKICEDKKILYTTAEDFVTDLVNFTEKNSIINFREKYKKYDVLMVDDLHWLLGSPSAQEEIIYLLDWFNDDSRQLILSLSCLSHSRPNSFPLYPERLLPKITNHLLSSHNRGIMAGMGFPNRD